VQAETGRIFSICYSEHYLQPSTAAAARLVADGAIGKVKSATLYACWPRGAKYYGRSTWAGKAKRNGAWVMDSPASNALAHYINLALFFLGRSFGEMASPAKIEAELYRVNPIETFDTCSLRVTLDDGVPLLILFTHACDEQIHPRIEVTGESGTLRYVGFDQLTLDVPGKQQVVAAKGESRPQMVSTLARWTRGQGDDLVVSLEMARKHLEVVNGASEATPVYTISEPDKVVVIRADGDTFQTLRGIEAAFTQCAAKGQMLHESGLVPWSKPAGVKSLENYTHFNGPR
jgi:predicted dehydrogenase